MFPKILCTLILLPLLEANSSWIQDPTKVEATHYKLAFENERVQVVNIHYGPREKSALHNQPGGVVVVLTSGHLKFTDEKGKRNRYTPSPASADGFRHSSTQ